MNVEALRSRIREAHTEFDPPGEHTFNVHVFINRRRVPADFPREKFEMETKAQARFDTWRRDQVLLDVSDVLNQFLSQETWKKNGWTERNDGWRLYLTIKATTALMRIIASEIDALTRVASATTRYAHGADFNEPHR